MVRWAVLLVLMVIVSLLVVAGLNDTIGSIVIGFFIALTDLIFRKPKGIN